MRDSCSVVSEGLKIKGAGLVQTALNLAPQEQQHSCPLVFLVYSQHKVTEDILLPFLFYLKYIDQQIPVSVYIFSSVSHRKWLVPDSS